MVKIVNGAPFPSREFNQAGRGLPLIRIRDVGVNDPKTYFDGPYEESMLVRPGDLLVGMDGDFRLARWSGPVALMNQRVCRLVPVSEDLDEQWLLHSLQGYLDAIWAETSSVTVKHLSSKSIAEVPLPLPPLEEQRRIVGLLEDHLSRLDAAALWIDHARTRLMSAKQASMDAAVAIHEEPRSEVAWAESRLECWQRAGRKGTPPDPATPNLDSAPPWTGVVSLEAVTDADRLIRYGILMPRVADGVGTVPYIEVKDLRGHTLEGKSLRKTSSELDHQFAGARVRPGDVVMAVRGSYDRSATVPEGFAGTNLSRDVARIAPLPGLSPEYLQAWLQSSFSRRYLAEHARGVAVKGINIATLRSLPIVVPSAQQQERAVVRLDMQLSGLNRIDTQLASALLRASSLRRALLAAAFAGALNRPAEFMEGTNV